MADFGLALVQNSAELTLTGDLVGTLRYMSPEQLEEASTVDPRTDVYSLGATLYETLCGRPAFDGQHRAEVLRHVLQTDPPDPRRLDPRIPSDLATIVLKCLAKSPHDRYQSAAELADDLRRFREHRPILAKQTPAWKHAWRWAQRHRRLALATGVALAALITLAVGGPLAALKLRQSLRNEQQLTRQLGGEHYDGRVREASHAIAAGHFGRAEELLQGLPPDQRDFEWFHLWNQVEDDRRHLITNQPIDLIRVALSPDGSQIACGNWFGHVLIFDRDSRRQLARFKLNARGQAIPFALQYAPDGELLFVGGERHAMLWDAKHARIAAAWETESNITAAAISPDGGSLAIGFAEHLLSFQSNHTATDTGIQVLNVAELIAQQAGGEDQDRPVPECRRIDGLVASVNDLDFAPDGNSLMACTNEAGILRRWAIPSLEELPPLRVDDPAVRRFAFFPQDSAIVAVASGARTLGGDRGRVGLHSVESGKLLKTVYASTCTTKSLAFSPDGTRLVIGQDDGQVLSWDTAELFQGGEAIPAAAQPHQAKVYDLAVPATASTVISAGGDGFLKEYRLAISHQGLTGHEAFSGGVEFLGDGRAVSWGSGPSGNQLRLWRIADGQLLKQLDTGDISVTDVAILPSRQEIAYVGYTWRAETRGEIGTWGIVSGSRRTLFTAPQATRDLVVSKAGDLLIAGFGNRLVVLGLDGDSPAVVEQFPSNNRGLPIARQPHTDVIAIAESVGTGPHRITLWDSRRRAVVGSLSTGEHEIWSLAFSPTGKLAAGTLSGKILLWEELGRPSSMRELTGHFQNVYCVRFSPTASRLASAGLDSTVRLWNTATGNELLSFDTAASWNYRVAFTSDGETLAYAGGKGTVSGPIHFLSAKREAAPKP